MELESKLSVTNTVMHNGALMLVIGVIKDLHIAYEVPWSAYEV